MQFEVIDEACRKNCWRRDIKRTMTDELILRFWEDGGSSSYKGCVMMRCPADFCYMSSPCYKNDRFPGYDWHCLCPTGNAKDCQHPCENDPNACRDWLGTFKESGADVGSFIGNGRTNYKTLHCGYNPSACRDPAWCGSKNIFQITDTYYRHIFAFVCSNEWCLLRRIRFLKCEWEQAEGMSFILLTDCMKQLLVSRYIMVCISRTEFKLIFNSCAILKLLLFGWNIEDWS